MAMANDANRLAQVFIWKEGEAPDLQYARQILSVVNPDAARAIEGNDPPLHMFAVQPPWPRDPWARAIADLHALGPASANGAFWTDTSHYDLAGWQGSDRRTGEHIFVVSAYSRVPGHLPATSDAPDIQGEGVAAPANMRAPGRQPAVPQVPYYPLRPTGPLAWPPTAEQGQQSPGYGPMTTGPLAATGQLSTGALNTSLLESYRPYYASFGSRVVAGLVDFFFMSLFQVITVSALLLLGGREPATDFSGWFSRYSAFGCLALLVFVGYHVVQWSLWGRTIGKRLAGIKIVAADGSVPGWGRSLLRMLGYFFSLSIGGWGVVMIVLDPRHQALHDKIAETFVVPERVHVPIPVGLPGYPLPSSEQAEAAGRAAVGQGRAGAPSVGMANVASATPYSEVQIALGQDASPRGREGRTGGGGLSTTVWPNFGRAVSTTETERIDAREAAGPALNIDMGQNTIPNLDDVALAGSTLNQAPLRPAGTSGQEQMATDAARARTLFKQGLEQMERGVSPTARGYRVDPAPARAAAALFRQAVDLVPGSVLYRYFHAIALRYSEGFEVAISELRRVLEQDPTHYEARQQVAYGPRWHDAFAYPAWVSPAPVDVGAPLPDPIRGLLPPGQQPATRMVLLREGGMKVAAFLSRTPRSVWKSPPTPEMPARLQLYLSRTPFGPIIALYILVQDDPQNPWIGETFLNPHDPGAPSEDACQLGQNMLEQIARQDRTYLIFADDSDRLLLSRKLVFDAATQVSTARMLYEVQSLPPQVMDQDRFGQAAQWHMDHFSLDQVKG